MTEPSSSDRRGRPDRRRRVLSFWNLRRLHGRRAFDRRGDRDGDPYFVERISAPTFLMSALLLVFTLVDGLFTIALLGADCEELNPAMRYLINQGPVPFLIGKYVLTAIFLPVALVMNRYRLFGTRFRVGYLIPIVAGLYLVLISYQVVLWRVHRDGPSLTRVSPRTRSALEPARTPMARHHAPGKT